MKHACLVSGKDSARTALLLTAHYPDLEVEYIFNPTGAELPEVEDWLDNKLAPRLGKSIIRVGADLPEIIRAYNFLPSGQARYCTREAKIEPTEAYFSEPTTVYYGLRADEPERLGYVPRGKKSLITPRYPLREHGLTLMDVWNDLERDNLLPPLFFWQRLHDRVVELLGEYVHILSMLPKPLFYMLFAWRSRPNCYFCFYQRLYEFIGLLEHHPDLFWQAVELEESTGAAGYTLQQGHTLRSIANRADEIFEKRAQAIVKQLGVIFQSSFLEPLQDTLTQTSCGILCGK